MVPTFTETLFWGVAIFFGFILLYALVDRICVCCEKCAIAKFAKFGDVEALKNHVNS